MNTMTKKLDPSIERSTRNAPFIEIRDAYQRPLYLDWRRIVSVRDPSYDTEKPYGSVLVVDGIPRPWLMDDTSDTILELIGAASANTEPRSTGDATSFIPLTLTSGKALYVDHRWIIGVKESPDGESTLVFIDGYRNESDEGDNDWSLIVTDSWRDILTAIRQAEQRVAAA